MKPQSKAIWLTAAVVIVLGVYQQTLGVFDLFCILFVTVILIRVFADDNGNKLEGATADAPKVEVTQANFAVPEGKHLITTDGVKQVRNLLLRHHNMKQTDRDYTASDMSKQTVAIVASLNVFLKGR